MSTHKRLSHLSIAAAALLTVAVPSFAQTKSFDPRTEATSAGQVVAFNREHNAVPVERLNRTLENVANIATSAAPAKAKLRASQFSLSDNNLGFTKPQTRTYEVRLDQSIDQFNGDNDAGSTSSKRITFVPSRGPKYPY
jgi:hypothetical protein